MFVLVDAPINIALVKYWGKCDIEENFPSNTSISLTISTEFMGTRTKAHICNNCGCGKKPLPWITLNNHSEVSEKVKNIIQEIEKVRIEKRGTLAGIPQWTVNVVVESWNIGPTSVGLASSSSGYAALALALCRLDQHISYNNVDLARIAQKGSGSAARSMFGGFSRMAPYKFDVTKIDVDWDKWRDFHVWIIKFGDGPKDVLSTEGMIRTGKTSELYHDRYKYVMKRAETVTNAILTNDYQTLLHETMVDSNQMHAVCMDTYPPLIYLTDASFEVIKLVHKYNDISGIEKIGYTFDAGCHAILFGMQYDLASLEKLISGMIEKIESIYGPDFKVRLFKTKGTSLGARVIESDLRPI